MLRGFLSNQMSEGKAKSTVARRLATLRSFFKYLYQEGYVMIKLCEARTIPKSAEAFAHFS